jgi:hypothetical protein
MGSCGISSITHNSYGRIYPNSGGGQDSFSMGGRPIAPPHPPFEVRSIASSHATTPFPIPLAQPNTSLGSSSFFISILEDSLANPKVNATSKTLFIKDKLSHLGLKDITDKDSWIKARKIIDARLRCLPYCPSMTSKALITTPANQAASSWWEEVIYFNLKPPISDLFVKNPQFNQKGFKVIAHIDQYFHPTGAVDSLGYIFQLIDIKQGADKPVITLKVRFSCLFALLKMGGTNIDSPLQVGFILRSLLPTYHGMVKDFKLGQHSLATALLQMIMDQCTSYDKDPWKGPVGKGGKPSHRPLATA